MTQPSTATAPHPAEQRERDTTMLTVVVVAYAGDECLPACLDSLAPQAALRADIDVVVTCDDRLTRRTALQQEYPWVRWLHTPGIVHPAVMRARGVKAAEGTYIALTEDHCLTAPGWCDAALHAVETGTAVQGGPIDKAVPDSPLNWAGYWLEFAYYMPPIPADGNRASDCNTTYSRAALESVRDVWENEFHETTVNWALHDRGFQIKRDPGQLVFEHNPLRLVEALRERLAFGRTYARTRSRRLARPMQLALACAAPLLPIVLTARIGRIAAEHDHLADFARALPWFLALASAWTVGELLGYLTGNRQAEVA